MAILTAAFLNEERLFVKPLDKFRDERFPGGNHTRHAARRQIHHCLHTLDEGTPARRHFQTGEIAGPVEHAISERLLLAEQMKDVVLNGAFGDEIDNGDRTGLVFASGSCDALFELGGIPGQIDVNDGACGLQVQPDAAAVG